MCAHSSVISSPDREPRVAAVVVAAGAGLRMGSATRKQYAMLLNEPVLAWSIRAFTDHPGVGEVIAVLPPEDLARVSDWVRELGAAAVGGGARRSDSVRHGLSELDPATDLVLVHDGARPFVSADLIGRLIDAGRRGPAIPATPATDTLKEADHAGFVARTLDRARVWHAQTPQIFPVELLRSAHERAAREGWELTDDAALCERIGIPVRLVEGEAVNMKITLPLDLEIARAVAAHQRGRSSSTSPLLNPIE